VRHSAVHFLKELRRRRVFRVAGLYVVAMWLLMQAANILFPAWGIPDAAINFLLWAGLLGFPLALVFGWMFDISAEGIRRTQPVSSAAELQHSLPLRRADYLILTVFLAVMGAIVYDTTHRVIKTAPLAGLEEWRPVLAEVEPNSVAVLPFTDLSAERDQEYFTDGISEEILNRLSSFVELKVIGRTSSFSFRDSNYDIARISGLLGVRYLLQGSVRRDGPQLRISAQLVDNAGVQVWSNTFDRGTGGIFALQDEIAESVAGSILPKIVPPPAEARQPDLEAYEHYLIGREIFARRIAGFPERSIDRFTRAIELDPEFAEPYAERAIARLYNQVLPRAEEHARAQQDFENALVLQPDLARAHAAQAAVLIVREPNAFAAHEAALRRVLELDPAMVDAMTWLAWALHAQGRPAEAEKIMMSAARIDPLDPIVNSDLAWRDAGRGRPEEAERRLLRLLEIPQPSVLVYFVLTDFYTWNARLVEAVEIAKRMVLLSIAYSERPMFMDMLMQSYGMLGLWQDAEYWGDRAARAWPEQLQLRLLRAHILAHDPAQPGHGEALRFYRDTLDAAGIVGGGPFRHRYGTVQALAGDHAGAIETLQPIDARYIPHSGFRTLQVQTYLALAWTWVQSGDGEKAVEVLDALDGLYRYKERLADDQLHISNDLADYALHQLLLGEQDAALELLGQAAEAGWRDYYRISRDPRWATVKDDPRYVQILARIKEDVDAQRERMEEIDAADDFAVRLDAAIAARQSAPVQP
jgi:TolB-like protein/Tfp pilus assembly protein PilF